MTSYHHAPRNWLSFIVMTLAACAQNCEAFVAPPWHSSSSNYEIHSSPRHIIPPLQASSSSSPQLLEFVEPTTGVTVKLIGCMHYNPHSIQLTRQTIHDLAAQDQLGSVLIESCDLRWNSTTALPPWIQSLLQSEMKTACQVTLHQYQRPVLLGDQRINITVQAMGTGVKETLIDLVTPWTGGWQRLVETARTAQQQAWPLDTATDPTYLTARAFLDPQLLVNAPVSLLKYPLSYLVRSPLPTLAFLGLLILTEQPVSEAATTTSLLQDPTLTVADWLGTWLVTVAELAVFSRVFLKELLAERNQVLAANILEQCQLYQPPQPQPPTQGRPWNFFGKKARQPQQPSTAANDDDPRYVIGSPVPKAGEDKVVVAVLGMAHCNGIYKLLKEQTVQVLTTTKCGEVDEQLASS